MKIEIDASFERDAKKLPDSLLDELKAIYEAIEKAQVLDDCGYEVKKMAGSKKSKGISIEIERTQQFQNWLLSGRGYRSFVAHPEPEGYL